MKRHPPLVSRHRARCNSYFPISKLIFAPSDAKTEVEIIDTLVKLRDEEGLTMVSVSHHPSTAVEADSIVVLDHGVVAEEGAYDKLVSVEGGIFKGLVEASEKDNDE